MNPLDLDGLDGLFSSDLPPERTRGPARAVVVVEETVRFSIEGSVESAEPPARGRPWLWFGVGAGLGGLALGVVAVALLVAALTPLAVLPPTPQPPPAPTAPVVAVPVPAAPAEPPLAAPASAEPPAEWVVHFAHDSVEPLDPSVPAWVRGCAAVDVVGFTDATGPPDVNDRIGRGRAEAVRRLLAGGRARVTARSAGEAAADPTAPPERRDQDRRAVARCRP